MSQLHPHNHWNQGVASCLKESVSPLRQLATPWFSGDLCLYFTLNRTEVLVWTGVLETQRTEPLCSCICFELVLRFFLFFFFLFNHTWLWFFLCKPPSVVFYLPHCIFFVLLVFISFFTHLIVVFINLCSRLIHRYKLSWT